MSGKAFFIDLSKCTACRGCQVACKQWKNLPAEQTRNVGTHQNPQDLSANTLKLVRFEERTIDGRLKWLFFPEQCRHCVEPSCMYIANMYAPGSVRKDEKTGAVVFTEASKDIKGVDPLDMCPYNIPRRDPETGIWNKCNMCEDRVAEGMLPSCVLTCPTGAMNFGDRDDMVELAESRLKKLKKTRPDAMLADIDDVRVIYLLEYGPETYSEFTVATARPKGKTTFSRREMFAGLARPLRNKA